ncbi:MAG TPA: translation elongation factor Ts [Bacillota bacterium]|nr:translation elongation factor Ts [Bacillota bacterium]HPJ86255.1 translation elongation factor Ts [Bacillota bacterium]HPQ62314.1 translation elongation factor Ts [Bacillota bacterium]HRX91902.1 translation elongation factor Ts [Candidatus Izemoplasmatales bacterium]
MEITAAMVKELREQTGAGLMDCKKALVATEGNLEAAVEWLREKGITKALNKATRIAAEGICNIKTSGDKALVYELNCETDFVAQNEKFRALSDTIGEVIIKNNVNTVEEALAIPYEGKTLNEFLLSAIASIGENINLRRMAVVNKKAEELFGYYVHMGGKIASLTVMNGGNFDTAKDVAMQVTASNPLYLSQEAIPADVTEHERMILTKEALNENAEAAKPKPEAIIIKMVEGRLQKNLKEICLVNQPFIKNPDQSVGDYVKANGAAIVAFTRLAVGEGIEKKEDNFAEEVMAQTKKC